MTAEKYRLILVEDADDDVDLFRKALTRSGLDPYFEIAHCFPNGEEAIKYFSKAPSELQPGTRPEIAIIDISLPGLNGFEVIAAMRKNPARPVIGIFTSSQLAEDKEKASALAADIFLTKTFDSPDFGRFLHFLSRVADERRA